MLIWTLHNQVKRIQTIHKTKPNQDRWYHYWDDLSSRVKIERKDILRHYQVLTIQIMKFLSVEPRAPKKKKKKTALQ